MVSGLLFGGAAAGIGQGLREEAKRVGQVQDRMQKQGIADATLAQGERGLDIKEADLKQKAVFNELKRISDAKNNLIDNVAKFSVAAGNDPAKVKGILGAMQPGLARLLVNEQNIKNPGSPLDPARANQMAVGLLQAASSGQTTQKKSAAQTGGQIDAKIAAIPKIQEAVGGTSQQAAQGLGLTDAPQGGDLIDATDNLKSEVSNAIRRSVNGMITGRRDQFGQPRPTPQESQRGIEIAAKAERILRDGLRSGQRISINEAVQQASEGQIPKPGPERLEVPQETRRKLATRGTDIKRAKIQINNILKGTPLSTGAISNLAALADATVGQITDLFGGGTLFPKTQEARQKLRTFVQTFRGAFINNPRFPEGEQKRLAKLVPDPETFFENPATAVKQLGTVFRELSLTEEIDRQILDGKMPNIPQFSDPSAPEFLELPSGTMFIDGTTGAIRRKK